MIAIEFSSEELSVIRKVLFQVREEIAVDDILQKIIRASALEAHRSND